MSFLEVGPETLFDDVIEYPEMVMARTIVITDTYLILREKLFQYISETSFQEAFHFLYKNIYLKKTGSPYLQKANLKLVDN